MSKRTLLAVAVVVTGALGVAMAQTGSGPNSGKPAGPASAVAGIDPTGRTLWAVVNPEGTTARGFLVDSSSKVDCDEGCYEVIFKHNLRGCAYVATLGGSDHVGIDGPGMIEVEGRGNNPKGVFVATYDPTGAFVDRGFHLVVHC